MVESPDALDFHHLCTVAEYGMNIEKAFKHRDTEAQK